MGTSILWQGGEFSETAKKPGKLPRCLLAVCAQASALNSLGLSFFNIKNGDIISISQE